MSVYKKIKKDDTVKVIAGKDLGKAGKILEVDRKKGKVLVQGINMVKKTMRKSQDNPNGGIKEMEAFIDISNVMLLDPKTKEPTKVGFKINDGKKVRYSKKSGVEID